MSDDSCRVDAWLWRARFFRTRSLAAEAVTRGRVRLVRAGRETRLDKPSRAVRPGDGLVFAWRGRLNAIRVESLGDRRGPAQEARRLYAVLDADAGTSGGIDT